MSMWDGLPCDVVARILVNLPFKDVIRSTSLQKSVYSLVHSRFFVDAYARHSLLYGTNPQLILVLFTDILISQRQFYWQGIHECVPLHSPYHNPYRCFTISNCCNSLACLFDYLKCEFILWNPYIQTTLNLPPPNSPVDSAPFLGVAFVNETSDHKVLMVSKSGQAELYSLRHNSWKTIAPPGITLAGSRDSPLYVRGSLYWINVARTDVGVFDVEAQVFRGIRLPEGWGWTSDYTLELKVHSESSIAVIRRSHDCDDRDPVFEIQVMDVDDRKWNDHSHAGSVVVNYNKEGDQIVDFVECVDKRKNTMRLCMNRIVDGTIFVPCAEIPNNHVCNLALLDAPDPKKRMVFE